MKSFITPLRKIRQNRVLLWNFSIQWNRLFTVNLIGSITRLRQKRKQALEELSQEKLDAITNTRFYKFYPLEAPDNTVMPKSSYINR
ncbi:hypothetical protein CTI12_AA014960 [Artemisia annua]|uniref:Uncharacterized protein n=1 Tax=Artemisia annua TaxID=35608 RepID=A0A2U1QLE0_ARTAN|nr:hypothetical protein CTI12_AA014960 [Artemisia annua]